MLSLFASLFPRTHENQGMTHPDASGAHLPGADTAPAGASYSTAHAEAVTARDLAADRLSDAVQRKDTQSIHAARSAMHRATHDLMKLEQGR